MYSLQHFTKIVLNKKNKHSNTHTETKSKYLLYGKFSSLCEAEKNDGIRTKWQTYVGKRNSSGRKSVAFQIYGSLTSIVGKRKDERFVLSAFRNITKTKQKKSRRDMSQLVYRIYTYGLPYMNVDLPE